MVEIGDDEADVEAEPCRLDAGDGASLLVPGAGLVARLGEAAHDVFVGQSALGANDVGGLVDLSRERLRAGKAEHVVDVALFAPGHRLGPGVVPVAAEQDAGRRPARADAAHEPAQMGAHLDARRRLAGA